MPIAQLNEIKTLEIAQDVMLELVTDIEKIWGQLNSENFKRGFKNQAEYDAWAYKANDAYQYKRAALKELRAYTLQKFDWEYKKPLELRLAVQRRNIEAPDWLQEDGEALQDLPLFQNGNGATHQTETVQEVPAVLQYELNEIFGAEYEGIIARLTEARKAAKVTQQEAADLFGYHGTTVTGWEKRTSPITLLNLMKLVQFYDADLFYILTGERYRPVAEGLEEVAQYIGVGLESLQRLLNELKG